MNVVDLITALRTEKEMIKNSFLNKTVIGFFHNRENDIRYKNLVYINTDQDCNTHLDLLQESTRLLYEITMTYKHTSDDELALLCIGIRLFNDIMCSLTLVISGYYQISIAIQRDLLETGFLLDYFRIDKAFITRWRECSRRERMNQFRPKKIREALDTRNGFTTGRRENEYQLMCEYASHPTHEGSRLYLKEGLAEIGPFSDEAKVKNSLFELVKLANHGIANFICHFRLESTNLNSLVVSYMEKSKKWVAKYMQSE